MSFSENLKQVRKEKGISQEELAELLGVSRQAVSKWEQDQGYPEVEKLLLLSSKLNVSLDSLMSMEIAKQSNQNAKTVTGSITITSPDENVIARCYKVVSSNKFRGGKQAPKYALFGVGEGTSFWGQPTQFLGWYETEEQLSKEIEEIKNAIINGEPLYTLQYSAKVERHFMNVKIVKD